MVDLDLRTFGRNILLLVAILSALVIGEMVLVSAEEPPAAVHDSSQQSSYREASASLTLG
jgi:hypothetical protein